MINSKHSLVNNSHVETSAFKGLIASKINVFVYINIYVCVCNVYIYYTCIYK